MSGDFTETTGTLARKAGHASPTIRVYADLGLLDYVRAANGVRLFRTGQEDRVRQLCAERIARRGRRRKAV